MTAAVTIENLFCAYGENQVLKDISFSIPKGDFFIVIGPNGSGKTTLMKNMSGIRKNEKGRIRILDRSLNQYRAKALAKMLALVPQDSSADFPFTAMELVLMGRTPYLGILGFPQKEDMEIAAQALTFTGVDNLSHRRLTELSGGERQLVYIARAICQEPEIILLDEPTAALDLAHQVRIMDLMERLKMEKGITVVMVSHDLNLAAMYGDTLLLLKEGRIVKSGTPEDVLKFDVLEDTYGCEILVEQSSLGKYPRVTPVPKKFVGT